MGMESNTASTKDKVTQEDWDWGRWFNGFISGRRLGKTLGLLIQMAIIILFLGTAVLGVLWIKEKLMPSVKPPAPDVIDVVAETAELQIDKSSKTVNNTFFPLSSIFGSTGKVQDTEQH